MHGLQPPLPLRGPLRNTANALQLAASDQKCSDAKCREAIHDGCRMMQSIRRRTDHERAFHFLPFNASG